MIRPWILGLTLPVAISCDLVESASSTIIVSGLFVKTPDLTIEGRLDVPGETLATVWLGERESVTSTEEPTPIGDADIKVTFAGNAVVLPESEEKGIYAQNSTKQASLVYAEGTRYDFVAKLPSDSETEYGGSSTAPAPLSAAAISLDPQPSQTVPGLAEVGVHPRNTALTLTWGTQYGRYAFVSVFRADANDPSDPQLVFDSRPKTAKDVLQLLVGDPPTTITVPAEVFAQDGVYAVVLVAANQGERRSNTFLGSPFLVGTGAAVFLGVLP